jgi:hypothetical protein
MLNFELSEQQHSPLSLARPFTRECCVVDPKMQDPANANPMRNPQAAAARMSGDQTLLQQLHTLEVLGSKAVQELDAAKAEESRLQAALAEGRATPQSL